MADAKETSKARPSRREPTTPDDYPVVPPTGRLAAIDHSFLLQSIMEVQGSIGKLTEAVTGLKEQSKDHGQKIERLSLQLDRVVRRALPGHDGEAQRCLLG